MITQKNQEDGTVEYSVKHITFDIQDRHDLKPENCKVKKEVKLDFDSEAYNLKNKEIADFKFCAKEDQVRLVLKHKEKPEFECFCFDFSEGAMNLHVDFNKISPDVPNQSNKDPIAWIWLADCETLTLKDRREVKYIDDREAHKEAK